MTTPRLLRSALPVVVLALVLGVAVLPPASARDHADAGPARAAAGPPPLPGRYAGHLYEGTPPAEGWPIRLQVVSKGGRKVMKGWGRSVVFSCYRGSSAWTQSIGLWVPRTVIRRGRAVRTWRTSAGVVGELRLRFHRGRVTGTLEYQASGCYLLYNQVLLRRRR